MEASQKTRLKIQKNLPPTLTPDKRLYQLERPIIGVTGGIASGKSTFLELLKKLGRQPINADQLVKEVYQIESVQSEIQTLIPSVFENGQINFKELRKAFFSDSKLKSSIEKIIYRELPKVFLAKSNSVPDQVLYYEIPLLFEKELTSFFDIILLVDVSDSNQTERLKKRDQISDEEIQNILKAQFPLATKRKKAHVIFDNNPEANAEANEERVQEILAELDAALLTIEKHLTEK